MRKTLYTKFILAYLLFGIFGFVMVATFVSSMTMEQLKREKAELLYQDAAYIADTSAANLYSGKTSLEMVKSQLDALKIHLQSTIWIINPSGRMILDSDKPVDVDNEVVIENFDPTVMAGSYYITGDFFGSFDREVLSVMSPVTSNYKVKGYVVIHIPMDIIAGQSEKLLSISYILLVLLFLLSMIILIFFTEFVYLPLRKITTATEHYASGDMKYELAVESDDEIGYLAAALQYMASEIDKAEDNQKKFVANVSHDFRSPLTSIKGYLEAIQDGTIPREAQSKYIGIVLNETERLHKLTSSLLTLNNLNVRGVVLEKTVFDINEIIRETAASAGLQLKSKSIRLDLVLTGDVLPVEADMGKIQQVLHNLLDNAIKFSGNDSVIIIETTVKRQKVFVSVKDRGIGIPKDSLKLIWDRFYKTDLSRGKDKKGTGLGLAITREIIKAHGENINVTSTEGVGTEFIFSLPLIDDDED